MMVLGSRHLGLSALHGGDRLRHDGRDRCRRALAESTRRRAVGLPDTEAFGDFETHLERIEPAGDLVLDPFCGCGTTIAAAQILARRWIGIDISPFAIELIRRQRLEGAFPHLKVGVDYEMKGLPTTIEGARMMAEQDKDRKAFEIWAVSKVDGIPNDKKGADKGMDGNSIQTRWKDDQVCGCVREKRKAEGRWIRAPISVAKREEASSLGFGVLVTLNEPTAGMRADAASARTVELHGNRYPLVQILTVEEILKGMKPHLPLVDPTVGYGKKAGLADIQCSFL